MHSCLYEGTVFHQRLSPVKHGFRYSISLLYLDLDEVSTVFAGRWFWSAHRAAVARFDRRDHLGSATQPLADAVREEISRQGFQPVSGPIRLLTQPRYLGYVMNPVSFYYCFDEAEHVRHMVAEVTNTPWGERHCYVLPFDDLQPSAKEFHVSPFMPMDMVYHWDCTVPRETMQIGIQNYREQQLVFQANLELTRKEINTANLAWSLVRFPLMTQQTIFAIYWQAFLLWRKGCPYFPHPNQNERPQPKPEVASRN